jgi:hypothetical protein
MIGRKYRTWGLGLGANLVLVGIVSACAVTPEGETCATYACVNQARLIGEVAVPDDAGLVNVKYCSEVDCVEGKLDLSKVGSEPSCLGPNQSIFDSDVCFTRGVAGKLKVEASLQRQDDMTLPPDGERYTLEIIDAAGDTLFEETREADYETTREDNCHLCWQAEMSL